MFPDVSFRFASLREKIAVSRNTKFHATALYFAKQRNSFRINFAKQNFTGNFNKMVAGRTKEQNVQLGQEEVETENMQQGL